MGWLTASAKASVTGSASWLLQLASNRMDDPAAAQPPTLQQRDTVPRFCLPSLSFLAMNQHHARHTCHHIIAPQTSHAFF